MTWYQWIFWISLAATGVLTGVKLIRLVRRGSPPDLALPKGPVRPAIRYAFTGAMNPKAKESAYLHWPTYIAGIAYHIGTFLALGVAVLVVSGVVLPDTPAKASAILLLISGGCGAAILVKRIVKPALRALSGPDDYLSNILVTGFQVLTAGMLITNLPEAAWYLWTAVLLAAIPLGKLKHSFYFFAARRQLGIFFGRRGVWPPPMTNPVP